MNISWQPSNCFFSIYFLYLNGKHIKQTLKTHRFFFSSSLSSPSVTSLALSLLPIHNIYLILYAAQNTLEDDDDYEEKTQIQKKERV